MGWLGNFFNLFFPRICASCGQPLLKGETVICTGCIIGLPYTNFWKYDDNPVAKKFWGQVDITSACALVYFRKETKVRKLVHLLKYRGRTEVGYKLGYHLGMHLKEEPTYHDVDLVVPIPLHPDKLRKRGYNQSDYIASGIADALGAKAAPHLVERAVFNTTQTKKRRLERYDNVQSIFVVNESADLEGKHVLVVDDVITTGATIQSCAEVLLKAARCRVSIAAIGTA